MMKPLVKLENVTAGYNGEAVLEGVDLEIFPDDFIGVIGPNGGGKTTLLKVILGLIKPWSGSVKYAGDPVPGTLMGYLPQHTDLDRSFPISVEEVVLSGLLPRKGFFTPYRKEHRLAAQNALEKTGINHLLHRAIGELSGGQLQRVLLARALVGSPRLLILDEPVTYVDNRFEGELYELLKELNRNMAILMVSHDVGTITSYIKTIACVNRTLHYHPSNKISEQQLAAYNCPIQIITHGTVPHTVLKKHS
ncbi:MAG: metal ABC transporter ATP-binding protein [Bacteroidales bacterium]